MGHSLGEYVAACVAGVFSLEDGLRLTAQRARLMQQLPGDGEMVAVFAPRDVVAQAVAPYTDEVAIAAENGPHNVVVSGRQSAVSRVLRDLHHQGFASRPLVVSHAFHSPLMEPVLKPFRQVADQVAWASPDVPLISGLTGRLADHEILTADYWCDHLRQTVKFSTAVATLRQQEIDLFVEIGPDSTLLTLAQACFDEEVGTWLPTMSKRPRRLVDAAGQHRATLCARRRLRLGGVLRRRAAPPRGVANVSVPTRTLLV